jgi:alpha-beta hydrolase superfamily lysophospholipase
VTDTSSGRPIYLRDGANSVFGFFHAPATSSPAGSAVVICPPFGWDEICSYRSRRQWAGELAQAGHPVVRLDLPGTGDSGGSPNDPGQVSSWTAAVGSAARRLRELTGLDRVAAIGIGLGGLVLCKAIAEDAPVDEVVLWAVPARGQALVRELRVFASLEHSPLGAVADRELEPPPLPDGYVWAGGFVLTAQTARELEQLDVAALPLPDGRIKRALMLDRDGVSVDERLRAHLERNGASVSVAPGRGYGTMMAQPHEACPPYGVFERVGSWLRDEDASEPAAGTVIGYSAGASTASAREETIELSVDGVAIRETPMTVAWPTGELFGILAEPVDVPPAAVCVVLLNAGAIRRIGPNRMWVEVARRWAAQGVHSLRLDLEGIGDAEGDPERLTELAALYTPELVDQVCAGLDELESRGVARRFVLAGLCSGAYWSFHAALRDERVAAAFMLNPQALFWDESLEASRAMRRGVMRTSSWRKLVRGQVPLERMRDLAYRAPVALPRRALARRSARRRGENVLEDALDRLRDTSKTLRFIFSGNEPLCEELELEGYLARLDRWPNVTIEFIPGHIHTLRPLQSQRGAHQALDRALADMLGDAGRAPMKASPASGG